MRSIARMNACAVTGAPVEKRASFRIVKVYVLPFSGDDRLGLGEAWRDTRAGRERLVRIRHEAGAGRGQEVKFDDEVDERGVDRVGRGRPTATFNAPPLAVCGLPDAAISSAATTTAAHAAARRFRAIGKRSIPNCGTL